MINVLFLTFRFLNLIGTLLPVGYKNTFICRRYCDLFSFFYWTDLKCSCKCGICTTLTIV